ncbi:conserved hypothetical protein [Synechococcus sp. PCC 7335]|uniref:BrnT family toxin n=1 Tax=Synechococcus sp. (strain ATCC 29403 / PCC 7335) TaxID=91464 RepID=UPI00017EBC82|nr:BrnT family toxin [Synechococcus sp. PCC 7335]EDX83797.1 conserved hypothetical protein [Synechococcus sp. PCC 7335]
MAFEFDENKSLSNKAKYGIDFIEAQSLWQDKSRLEVPARTEDEFRFTVIAKVNFKMWAAVITYRDKDIRIISVRRARKREVELYESSRF